MRPEPKYNGDIYQNDYKYNGDIYLHDYISEEDWQAFTKRAPAPAPVLEPVESVTPVVTQIHW